MTTFCPTLDLVCVFLNAYYKEKHLSGHTSTQHCKTEQAGLTPGLLMFLVWMRKAGRDI